MVALFFIHSIVLFGPTFPREVQVADISFIADSVALPGEHWSDSKAETGCRGIKVRRRNRAQGDNEIMTNAQFVGLKQCTKETNHWWSEKNLTSEACI